VIWYRKLLHGLAGAAALLLGAMALLVTLDVLMRNVGVGTLAWVNEVSEYSLPLATLLIAPWLLHRNEHVRLDVLLVSLPRAASRLLEKACDVVGIAICAVFVWYSLRLKTLSIPEWWQYALVPVCFSLLAVEFARRLRA
jgi:TRAP-type C4-dicarboxylate transport system permease small subunit